MKLYFARHAQTNTSSGILNPPLNEAGKEQAKKLADALKDVTFDAIISSPLARALQTAEIVNKHHQLSVHAHPEWREIETGAQVDLATWNDLFNFDKNIQLENGESLTAFFKRVYAAIDALKQNYKDKTILVVAHGGVQHAVYAYANESPLAGDIRVEPMMNCEYRVFNL